MTHEEVKMMCEQHNAEVETYLRDILPEQIKAAGYPVENGMTTMGAWFAAQRFINEQHFFDKGKLIMDAARAAGFDVRMDMQNDTLVF